MALLLRTPVSVKRVGRKIMAACKRPPVSYVVHTVAALFEERLVDINVREAY